MSCEPIGAVCQQIVKTCEKIESASCMSAHAESDAHPEIGEIAKDILLDELEHAQILVLALTRLISPEEEQEPETPEEDIAGE